MSVISERKVEEIIKNLVISFIKQFNINDRYEVDFFIPCKNIVIEYNGEQRYRVVNFCDNLNRRVEKFKKHQERDMKVKNYCLENNIKPLEMFSEIGNNYV